jgi:Uncharacterised nucleotidyltransferase
VNDPVAPQQLPAVASARSADALWTAVDSLLSRATVSGILAHKLGPLAVVRARSHGLPVPHALLYEERAAALGMLTGIALVERIREGCDGPLILMKGAELAHLYPASARRFLDVDVLVPDANAAYLSLLRSGFSEAPDPEGTPDDHHHLEPLVWPTIPLKVEVHSSPNWLASMRPPPLAEILEAAAPSTLGVSGVDAPHPMHHALILVSHAWSHEPLRTLRDLIDVAALAALVDERELEWTATSWGMGRVWDTTRRSIDCLFYGGKMFLPLRTWARHLTEPRERSVAEDHLARVLHAFWELPPGQALLRSVDALRLEVAPAPGETWSEKLARMTRAARDPHAPVIRHKRGGTGTEADSRDR